MKKRISLISAIIVTVLTLNLLIIGIFIIFNQVSYNSLAKKQSNKVSSLLYERTELYFYELLNEAASFNSLFCDQVMYNELYKEDDLSGIGDYSMYIIDEVKNNYSQIGVVSYGDELGRYIGLRINPDETVNLMLKDRRTEDKLTIYSSDHISDNVLAVYDEYDLYGRPWYKPVKDDPQTQWSDIYLNYDEKMNLTISVMTPILKGDEFFGVVTSDVSLNLINAYLQNDKGIGNGVIYIVDINNNIVSHSGEESYMNISKTNPPTYSLMSAQDVENPMIASSMNKIIEDNISQDSFSFNIKNKGYFGFVGQLDKPNNLGLRAVVVIPEDDLLADVKVQQGRSLMAVIGIVVMGIIVGIWVLTIITNPIKEATALAKNLSSGDFSYTITEGFFEPYETHELIKTLNHMVHELKHAFAKIKENELMLENKVEEKTKELKTTYDELLEREKLASLGGLVAGISHEINTPLGVAVSASSYLKEQNNLLYETITKGKLSKEIFANYLESTGESVDILESNLTRAAELISSFKQISADQSGSIHTRFFAKDYLESIFLTLRHEYKNKPFKYHINCDKDLEIYSYPGAMSQIFTNLIINALKHGFKGEETLIVNIDVEEKENDIIIKFKDNGRGIPPEQVRHIFEPFFTTKRNEGGSGLGLNIVYNIVTITLEGSITCESELNNGLLFTFKIPKSTQKG